MTSRTLLLIGFLALAVPTTWRAFADAEPVRGPFDVRSVSVPAEDRRAVLRGNTAFALDVYGRLRETPGNFVFSPLSLSTALAMTTSGAAGRTRDELASTLHLRLPPARLDRAFQSVLASVRLSPGSDVELRVANGLWVDSRQKLRRSFRLGLERHYDALAAVMDFVNRPYEARDEINRWGSDRTDGHIAEVLPVEAVPTDAAMVLADAVYFAGKWEQPFDRTRQELFWTPGGRVLVPLMGHTGTYRWSGNGDFQTVEMAYRGDDISMVVLVPKEITGLASVERSLTPETLATALNSLEDENVRLGFPSFGFRSALRLRDTLTALGMTTAFDPRRADFSRATGERHGVHVSDVRQSAYLRVDEEGTVAAAVTTVTFLGGGQSFDDQPREVTVDRPFLFLIRHRASGAILFLGRVEDPTK